MLLDGKLIKTCYILFMINNVLNTFIVIKKDRRINRQINKQQSINKCDNLNHVLSYLNGMYSISGGIIDAYSRGISYWNLERDQPLVNTAHKNT